MPRPGPRPHRPRPTAADACPDTGAWVGAVAAALLAVERRRASEAPTDMWGEAAPTRRRDERLLVDSDQLDRLIVQAVLELPADERGLILGRYRDGRSLDQLAHPLGLRRRALLARLREVLRRIGARVRSGCGGSSTVYLAALEASAADRPERSLPRLDAAQGRRLVAAAATLLIGILIGLSAVRDGSDGIGPVVRADDGSGGSERIAELPEHTGPRPDAASANGAVIRPAAAREAVNVVLLGVVDRLGALAPDAPQSSIGRVRAISGGIERVGLIDGDGRFSLAGLEVGLWRVTASLPGYEVARAEVRIEVDREPPVLQLEVRPAAEVAVQVVDSEGRGLFERPELLDDLTLTHGLSVWVGDVPPPQRVDAAFLQPEGADAEEWQRAADFDRLDPVDPERPATIGTLSVTRPSDISWAALVYGNQVVASFPWTSLNASELRFEVDLAAIDALRARVELLLSSRLGLDLSGSLVVLHGPNGESFEYRVLADGRLLVDGLPPGRWVVEIRSSGHGLLRRVLDVDPGGDSRMDDLELSAPLRVFGMVRNIAGQPVGAALTAVDLAMLQDPFNLKFQPETTSSPFGGGFSFSELDASGTYAVVLDHPNFALAAFEVSPDTAGSGMLLQATAGHDVTVEWGIVDVQPGRLMLLSDDNGFPLKLFEPSGDLAQQVKLAPGSYSITLWEFGAWGKQVSFDVPESSVQVDVNW